MEDDLNLFVKLKTTSVFVTGRWQKVWVNGRQPNYFVNGRQILLLEMEDDVNIVWKCCQMKYSTILPKNKARLGVEVGEKRIMQAQ
jgi:hypothetical protein